MTSPPDSAVTTWVNEALDPFDAATTAADVFQSLANQTVGLTGGRAVVALTLSNGALQATAAAGAPWGFPGGSEPVEQVAQEVLTGRLSGVRTVSLSPDDACADVWPVLALRRVVAAVAVLDPQTRTNDQFLAATCRYAGLRLSQLVDAELRADLLHERGTAIKTLRRLANTDALTGVSNRSGVFAVLNSLLGRGEQVGLIYVDLDGFKQINDGYGHGAGDRVLAAVAKRLRGVVRAPDVVGRLGGDEFVLVVRGGDEHALSRLVTRIQDVLSEPVVVKDVAIPVQASCGVAVTSHGGSAAELLALADARMYDDKHGPDRSDLQVIDLDAHR